MNLGDGVHGASPDHDKHARSPRTQETLQDIQDIIDRLAAVTRQLGRPGRGVPGTGRRPDLPDPVTLGLRDPAAGARCPRR
jgi:hypothetical protein